MSPSAHDWRVLSDEHGSVLVLFALFAPVLVLFASFVIDLGNSFLHARHLQVQADAAAFAGAQEFQPCVNLNVYERAGQYGGATKVITPGKAEDSARMPLYNTQVGGNTGSGLHALINSRTYFGQSSKDDTTEEAPCTEGQKGVFIPGMLDVKITETSLPWYLRIPGEIFGGVPYDNAHARIQAFQQSQASKVAPLAIAESSPVAMKAYFVNEDKGNEILASAALLNTGPNSNGEDIWTNAASPLSLAINRTNATTAHIGVFVALSGDPSHTKCGSNATKVEGSDDPYVKCFDKGATGPLLHIAGYSEGGAGTLTNPVAHKVTLGSPPGTCTDGYFSNSSTTCSLTISANVDYGSTKTAGIEVIPIAKGKAGSTLKLEGGLWKGTVSLNGAGSNEISLEVKCNNKTKGSPCDKEKQGTVGIVGDVHRSYTASTNNSGTIRGAWLSEGVVQDANSFEVCEAQDGNSCTHKLVVTVDVEGSLADAREYKDPVFHMRLGSSQSEVIGCKGSESSASEYRKHLAEGCPYTYKINTSDPNCTVSSEPLDCIGFASGVKTGPFQQGLEQRFVTEPPTGTHFYACNNWVKTNGEGVPLIPKDDSRVIQLFVEPYGSDGSKDAPIQDFATFYVTGWDGDPSKCKAPVDDASGNGEIVGHFIKYVNTINGEEGGGQKCTANALGQCIIVLTR